MKMYLRLYLFDKNGDRAFGMPEVSGPFRSREVAERALANALSTGRFCRGVIDEEKEEE